MARLNPRAFALAIKELFDSHADLPPALVACSAGIDSMALLALMATHYGRHKQLSKLAVCYIDHNQRPKSETQKDAELVLGYCRSRGIKTDVETLAHLSYGASENSMRSERYKCLARRASEFAKNTIVFTGHHANDRLETKLFRVLRGAHPNTLKGIAPRARRILSDGVTLRLARPLLAFTKQDILEYAVRTGIHWNEDTTNQSSRYARNRIRHELVPLFEDLSPGSTRRLVRFFDDIAVQESSSRATSETIRYLAENLIKVDGYLIQELEFKSLKAAIDVLLGEQSARTTRAHWETLRRLLEERLKTRHGGGPAKRVEFPGGYALHFEKKRAFWVKN